VQLGNASVAEAAPRAWRSCRLPRSRRGRAPAREARVRLATAVGARGALDGLDVEFPLDGRSPDPDRPGSALRREALLARSDVLASLAEYGASQSALQLEIARQYPDVRIGPGYEYDQGLNKWAVIGVSLELPVLNRNAGPIGEADARRTEAAARFAELQATVIDQLDRALANRDSSREALRRSEAVLAAESERVHSTTRSFDAGAADRLALRTAEVEFIRAERIHLDAQVRLQQARLKTRLRAGAARIGPALEPTVAARTGTP
jgi:outer membrane protein TolC